MNSSRAGKINKPSQLSSDFTSISFHSSKGKVKCPTPRSSTFSIDSVLAPFSEKVASKPFKIIKFENSIVSPKHRRQPSVIIKNVSQIYNFAMEKNPSSEEISEEEAISKITHHQKNSIFASTTDQKSTAYDSIRKKSCSDEENFKNESSEYAEMSEGITKPDENFTNLGMFTQEDGHNTPLGILPKKLYCKKCNLDTTTVVNIKMPTLPFWKTLCCIGELGEICTDLEAIERYQEFQHRCRICKTVIASAQPF